MADIKLFDTRRNDFPKDGSPFRTLQLFRCPVCRYETNLASYSKMAQPGIGGRLLVPCRYGKECWHHELQDEIRKLEKRHYASKLLREKTDKESVLRLSQLSYSIEVDIQGDVDESQIIEIWQNRAPASVRDPCAHCDIIGLFKIK